MRACLMKMWKADSTFMFLSTAFLYSNPAAPPNSHEISILLKVSLPALIQVCDSRKHWIKLLTVSGKVYYNTPSRSFVLEHGRKCHAKTTQIS